MRNGTGRTFWDSELMEPYLRVWKIAKGNHDLAEALAEQRRKDEAEAERAESLRRDQERPRPPEPASVDSGPDIMIRHPGWFPTNQHISEISEPADRCDFAYLPPWSISRSMPT